MRKEIYYKDLPTYMKVIIILILPVTITTVILLSITFGLLGFIIGMGLLFLLLIPVIIINFRIGIHK